MARAPLIDRTNGARDENRNNRKNRGSNPDRPAFSRPIFLDIGGVFVLTYLSMKKRGDGKSQGMMTTTISLDRAIYHQLGHLAVDEDTTVRDLIRQAIEEYLRRHKKGGQA